MKLKNKILASLICCLTLLSIFIFASCGEKVVPCAWVYYKLDGYYISQSNDMYFGPHIYVFENEEDMDKEYKSVMRITFYPRILGNEEVEYEDGKVKTTLVDIGDNYLDMSVSIDITSSIYSSEKSFYINDEKLDPTSISLSEDNLFLMFEDINLKRGNPNGRINGVINILEYE